MSTRRVFITGVAGFLGSHLADAFLTEGFDVVGVDNMIGGYLENVPAGVDFHRVDCNDFDAIAALMADVDVVYHCAATAYEGLSVFSPHFVTRNIVTATTGVVTAAAARRVRRFVLCSSMARYGQNPVPFTEDMEPRPQDPYGIGKLAAEHLVRNIADTHGLEWVIAVPHNIYGPRQKYDDPYRNVAAIFVNRILQGRPLVIYGDGGQKRCFSYVSDVVTPLRRMADAETCLRQVINVGPDDEFVSILELAQMIADIAGAPLDCEFLPPRAQEVPLANCSARKARALIDYRPSVPLHTGLRRMIDWIRERGPRPFDHRISLEIRSDRAPVTWSERRM